MGPSPYSMFEECFRVFLSSHILFVLLLLLKKHFKTNHYMLYNIHTSGLSSLDQFPAMK
jgi:hypothetical protein